MSQFFSLGKGERGDSTVVLMCALVLLMMAFFAVLNSMSVKDNKKERIALGSMLESLGVLPGGILPDPGKNLLLEASPMLDPAHDLASKGINPEAVYDLIHAGQGKKWYQIITLKKSSEGLSISLSSQSFFAPGSADLQTNALPFLDQITDLIQDSSCDVLIKGHSDNIPLNSLKYGSNWELSAARAMNVLRYFLQQGVPLARLEAAGYGEYDPLFPNNTKEHKALNRRVEIHLVQKRENSDSSKQEQNSINIHGFLFKMRDLYKK